MKLHVPLKSKEYLLFILSAVGFLIHLVDELSNGYDIPPYPVLIFSVIGWTIYPFCSSKLIRGILGVIASVGVIAGLANAHLIPFAFRGFTEGIVTAVIGTILAAITGIQAITMLLKLRK